MKKLTRDETEHANYYYEASEVDARITELEAQLTDWKALHTAIATGQPIWPNNWVQEVAMVAHEIHAKNAQLEDANQVANDCRIVADNAIAEAAKNRWIPVSKRLPESSIRLNLVIVAYFINGAEHQGSQKIRLAHYHASGAYIGWLPQKADHKEIEPAGWRVTKWLSVRYDIELGAAIQEGEV